MHSIDKLFVCSNKDCTLTFATEHHLLSHQKRHDMILNVSLTRDQSDTDETPTPTRFIRNCEEVGLFQDLQNVNPFEETFKQAIEKPKLSTLYIPSTSNDDTLHTPHIFPNITVPKTNSTVEVKNINTDQDSDSPLDQSDDLVIIEDEEEEEMIDVVDYMEGVKEKLKRQINTRTDGVTQKQQQSSSNNTEKMIVNDDLQLNNGRISSPAIGESSIYLRDDLLVSKEPRIRRFAKFGLYNNDKTDHIGDSDTAQDKRIRNRVAQHRSRLRKKMHHTKIENDMGKLENDNTQLRYENSRLKQHILQLKEYILSHKECAFKGDISLLKPPPLIPPDITITSVPGESIKSLKRRKILPAPAQTKTKPLSTKTIANLTSKLAGKQPPVLNVTQQSKPLLLSAGGAMALTALPGDIKPKIIPATATNVMIIPTTIGGSFIIIPPPLPPQQNLNKAIN